MNAIKINGVKEFRGIEIPVVEGGFGESKRCLSDKTIAKIHGIESKHVRESINRNIKRFKKGLDLLDLKVVDPVDDNLLLDLGYTTMQISKAQHIYILSERGYAKLIKIMDSDLAWEIHDELMDEYFTMREVINSKEQKKANLLLSIYKGGQEAILATKDLVIFEIGEATAPLIAENKELKPKAAFHDAIQVSKNCISFGEFSAALQNNKELKFVKLGRNTVMEWCRDQGYLCTSYNLKNKPSQQMLSSGYMEYKENVTECNGKNHITYKPLLSGKGQIWLTKKLIDYYGEEA